MRFQSPTTTLMDLITLILFSSISTVYSQVLTGNFLISLLNGFSLRYKEFLVSWLSTTTLNFSGFSSPLFVTCSDEKLNRH